MAEENRMYVAVTITSLTREKADEFAKILGLPTGIFLSDTPINVQFTSDDKAVVTWGSTKVTDSAKLKRFVKELE